MTGSLETFVRKPGRFVLHQYESSVATLALLRRILRGLKGLSRPSNLKVLTRQVYFTAVEPLPLILTGAFLIGAVIVTFIFAALSSFGLSDKVGKFVIIVLVDELSAFFIAIVLMIRSGSAVIAELGLMKLNRETDSLKSLGIDLHEYLLVPRFASIILSSVILTVLFCFVAIIGGFVAYGYINNVPFYDYMEILAMAAVIPDFVTVYVKALVFGFTIAIVSIRHGLEVKASITEVPVRLIFGLTRQAVFLLLFAILYDIFRYGNIL